MHKPIENCYWVVPGKFLAGEYPRDMDEESSRVKINALIHSGITVFIDLTDKNDNLLPYAYLLETALHQRFPIRDVSIPDSTDITAAILDTIDHHIGKGGMPARAGCGRRPGDNPRRTRRHLKRHLTQVNVMAPPIDVTWISGSGSRLQ